MSIDQRLIQFIESMATLGGIRNLGPTNPVILELQQPLTANLFTVVAALTEPSFMGIPINTTWVVLDPTSIYNKRALKLVSLESPMTSGLSAILDGGFTQSWIEVLTYADVFSDPQFYQVSGGTQGPQGLTGPQGLQGPQGPAPVIDYAYIIAQVLAAIAVKTMTALDVNGAGSLVAGASSHYSATATLSDASVLANLTGVTWAADPAVGTISSTGDFTAASITGAPVTGNISATYSYNGGAPMTAILPVTVSVAVVPIYPFYGVADQSSVKDEALVLGLSGRGLLGDLVSTFTLDSGAAGSTSTMFFAYPVSYGLAQFEDQSTIGFFGGWDAATGDPVNGALGPMTLNVTIAGVAVPFYLYETDFPGLGQITWKTTHKV